MSTRPPTKLRVSESVEWTVELPDYTAADGWGLTYHFVAETDQVRVPTDVGTVVDAGGGSWTVTLATADTATFSYLGDTGPHGIQGYYRWDMAVAKGTERKYLDSGETLLLRNLDSGAISAGADVRSHVRKTLDALEATLLGKASKDQLAYSIAGRSLSRMTASELIRWRNYLRAELRNEQNAERLERGLEGNPNLVKMRVRGVA